MKAERKNLEIQEDNMGVPATVIVAEDDKGLNRLIQESLQREGFHTEGAFTGSDAITRLIERPNALLLLDYVLPDMTGKRVIETLVDKECSVPFIVMTGHGDERVALETMKLGARDCIAKDEDFMATLGHVVKRVSQELEKEKRLADAEGALRESEEKLRAMFDSIADTITVTDLEGNIVDMNEAGVRMFGYGSKAELRGLRSIELIEKDQQGEAVDGMKDTLTVGYARSAEYTCVKKDGEEFPAETCTAVLMDSFGNPSGFVTVTKDITERKRAEKEKRRIESQLLQSQKMKALGTLAGGVAHDFGNLLTAIRGYADLALMKAQQDDAVHPYLRNIREASTRAVGLTSQLLLFSRRERVTYKPLDLNRVVSDLLRMLERLIGETYSMDVALGSQLWSVNGNIGNIEQLVMNLVVNARDGMPEAGKIVIRTENVEIDEKYCMTYGYARLGTFVCLSVRDYGIGMDSATIAHIFDPFFTTKGSKGSGLGLSVVYGIIKQHEGWITVESRPDKGSTFRVYLPATSERVGRQKEETDLVKEYQGNGEEILVVEDEKVVRLLTETIFRENGYVVFAAGNAREAFEIFEKEDGNFRMIFSDVVLPDESGVRLVDRLTVANPSLHVLLASGYTADAVDLQTIEEKGYRFLKKPYSLVELLQTTRELLDKGQSSGDSPTPDKEPMELTSATDESKRSVE
ncbi:hybrid sensor histidine kinase/response regulator [candidate division TA06 bacterium]|uniref:histidine kinase n=1 Tax=candidate division TA06 bacterium TaxID=2250710 RepID=A0A523USQ3_UNCT6|nr:MAG: hybrid sensor histidine kinase/response regulator [candidate division TA06 bacterium]